jgi:hypothetical protein
MSTNFTVIYDANIFFGAFRRTLLMPLAQAGIFRARWSEDIHKEWIGRLKEQRPDIDIGGFARRRAIAWANFTELGQ